MATQNVHRCDGMGTGVAFLDRGNAPTWSPHLGQWEVLPQHVRHRLPCATLHCQNLRSAWYSVGVVPWQASHCVRKELGSTKEKERDSEGDRGRLLTVYVCLLAEFAVSPSDILAEFIGERRIIFTVSACSSAYLFSNEFVYIQFFLR